MMSNSLISKEECHLRAEKTFNEYEQLLRNANTEEDAIQKTLKLFTQIDTLSKNTENSIQKSSELLDQVLDKKLSILSTVKKLNEIQQLLDLNVVVKNNWPSSTY